MVRPPDIEVPEGLRVGRVLRGDAKVFHVLVDGAVVQAAPRGRLFEELGSTRTPVAVGDWVLLGAEAGGGIERVLPRANQLSKVSSTHDPREQVLFANVDQLAVVASVAKPGFSSNRTDRILAACEWSEIPAFLVLNKLDLDREGDADEIRATYEEAGYDVLGTSAETGAGVDALRERLTGRTSALYGASGVGKSSLLNALWPELELRTGRVSDYWKGGKHTTTFSRLIEAAPDTWVVDTPGIRVFRPYGVNKVQLRFLFPDIAALQGRCRYPDCQHDHEPGCAVDAAVDEGRLAASRYLSYVEILDELEPPPDEVPTVDGADD